MVWATLAYCCWSVVYWAAGTSVAKGVVINLAEAMAERTDNTLDDLLVAKLKYHLIDDQKTTISPQNAAILIIEAQAIHNITKDKAHSDLKKQLEEHALERYKMAQFILYNLAGLTQLKDFSDSDQLSQILTEQLISTSLLRVEEAKTFLDWVNQFIHKENQNQQSWSLFE